MTTAILCFTLYKMQKHDLAPIFLILILIGMAIDAAITSEIITALNN